MTDKAVSALTSLTGANAATGDLLYIVDISEASAADRSKKITAQELQNYIKAFPATLGVGGATPAASGAGVSFPATASASSDANTLDDYEEGSWSTSIAIAGSTSAGTATYAIAAGEYTKIGRLVNVTGRLQWSGHTGTGDMRIVGLPFTSASISNIIPAVTFGYVEGIALTASNFLTGFVVDSSTRINFWQAPVSGGSATLVPMDAAGDIAFSATYFAA
jgi:hypothetical protein